MTTDSNRSADGAAALTVFTSNSTHALLEELATAYARETGCALRITADSAKLMMARIRRGESADVAVLGVGAIDELVAARRIAPASRRLFSRSRIGIAVRTGAPRPDISSVEAFRRTLLDAGSIAHTVHGASGMYFPQLAQRLGIADAVKHKIVTRPGGLIGTVVAAGEAEIAFQQIAELLAVPGIDLVGPIPEEVQVIFESAAGIFADSTRQAAAEALLKYFSSPAAAAAYAARGLEPTRTA